MGLSKIYRGTDLAFFVSIRNFWNASRIPDFGSTYSTQFSSIEKSLDWCICNNSGYTAVMYETRSVLKSVVNPATQHHKNKTIFFNKQKLVESKNCQLAYIAFVLTV